MAFGKQKKSKDGTDPGTAARTGSVQVLSLIHI